MVYMKIIVCDITGRTLNYDVALCQAINNEVGGPDSIELWTTSSQKYPVKTKKFCSIVPSRYRNSASIIVRFLKVIDTLGAYITSIIRLFFLKPSIFHLQWFPFLSLGTRGAMMDIVFIKLIKLVSPKTKLVYTIHNICPHSMKEEKRAHYNPVFSKGLSYFDHYIVHTERTRSDVCSVFNIDERRVTTIYHGVFVPDGFCFSPLSLKRDEINIIMYGNQNWYKGTDILVDSLQFLDDHSKNVCHFTICGSIDKKYLLELQNKTCGKFIDWIPHYLSDSDLYDAINQADIIVLPYRRISQSGVLLLALSTNRLIITSDLPTFKETLIGIEDHLFFKSEDPLDLARVIGLYANEKVDVENIRYSLEKLKALYSWEYSAKKTVALYKELTQC